jgi:hypothetical protein
LFLLLLLYKCCSNSDVAIAATGTTAAGVFTVFAFSKAVVVVVVAFAAVWS